jgi:glycosyltransferase involved in cell wall biosynthesis
MTSPNIQVGLVIPIFNVERTIGKVLDSIASSLDEDIAEVLLIDNCSADATLRIVHERLAVHDSLASLVTIIQHEENYGYGCSIKGGFDHFSRRDVSHVMVIHGDHQVDPAWLIGKLLSSLREDARTDLVLASRFKPESDIHDYSLLRKAGNYFFNATTTLCSGHRMSDSGTAMIVVRNALLQKVPFRNLSNSWQFHPQLNILMYGVPGVRIKEIPMNWADSDADSTVPLIRYGLILLKMLLLYWFKKNIRRTPSAEIFPIEGIPAHRRFTMLRTSVGRKAAFEQTQVRRAQ